MKLFCVGLHKTGTTSLKTALEAEGFKVADYFGIEDPDIGKTGLQQALSMVDEYDAFQDDPWYLYYREFHSKYPDAKFVLTTRDSEAWYQSCARHFGASHPNQVRKVFYGGDCDDPLVDKELWIRRKEKHEREVREYFSDFPESYLEMDITKGDDWAQLGPFIGHAPKKKSFPKTNTALQRRHHELYMQYKDAKGLKRFVLRLLMKIVRELDKS